MSQPETRHAGRVAPVAVVGCTNPPPGLYCPYNVGMADHICTNCPTHHYADCRSCFGFGVYRAPSGKLSPVTGREVAERQWLSTITGERNTDRPPFPEGLLPCPECGSMHAGVPV